MGRRLIIVGLLAVALAGCSPSVDTTPNPVTTAPKPTASPTSVETPRWTPEQQAAIDAALAYVDKWNSIAQNLDTSTYEDLLKIFDVAADPLATEQVTYFGNAMVRGLHLVGSPSFIPLTAVTGNKAESGEETLVEGCVVYGGAHWADSQGIQQGKPEETRPVEFIVLLRPDGTHRVTKDVKGDSTC